MYVLFYSLVSLAVRAWLAMLMIGVIHAEIVPEVPAFGYWATGAFCLLVDWLKGPGLADIKAAQDE